MIQSRYTAKSGLITMQQRLDTIGNNIANIDTVGFKNSRADFKSLIYSELERPVQPQDELNLNRGTGVTLGATTKSFLAGVAKTTNYPLDMMIEGDGFFSIQNAVAINSIRAQAILPFRSRAITRILSPRTAIMWWIRTAKRSTPGACPWKIFP